jgi:hypothetical protein
MSENAPALSHEAFQAAIQSQIRQGFHSNNSTIIRVPGSTDIEMPDVPRLPDDDDDMPETNSKTLPRSQSTQAITTVHEDKKKPGRKRKPEMRELLKPMMPAPPRYEPMESHRLPPLNSPDAHLFSIEYPGYVKNEPKSIEKFVEMCGGMPAIVKGYERSMGGRQSNIELRLRPDNPYLHPVAGEVLHSANLLLKIVRRRRKGQDEWQEKAEVVGVVSRTCRFRTLGDFQYLPDRSWLVPKLRDALDAIDGNVLFVWRLTFLS